MQVTVSGANFDAVTGGTTGPIVVRGFKDFARDGDKAADVLLGPCSSADRSFEISSNQYPAVTHVKLINRDVRFPLVSRVLPDITHYMSGRLITVHGERFLPNSTVQYSGITGSGRQCWPCSVGHAVLAMQCWPCSVGCAVLAMQCRPCSVGHAVLAMVLAT